MVEVFKTNVQERGQASMLVEILIEHFPSSDINFDLDDCDKILRVKHTEAISQEVPLLLNRLGFLCEELPE